MKRLILAPLALLAACATVPGAPADSFTITHEATVAAPPAAVYDALSEVGGWWEDAHTYSGDASNMWLDPVAGGCFCEFWNDGSVAHGVVVAAIDDRMVRVLGGLGPLQQEGVNGVMTWSIAPQDEGTALTFSYRVTGVVEGGLATWQGPVSGVTGAQFERLVRYVETGSPDES